MTDTNAVVAVYDTHSAAESAVKELQIHSNFQLGMFKRKQRGQFRPVASNLQTDSRLKIPSGTSLMAVIR